MILIAERFNTAKYGTVLRLWYVGGEHKVVRRPFDPYFYSLVNVGGGKRVEKKALSTLQEFTRLYKMEFSRTDQLMRVWDPSYGMEKIPYVQRVAIDEGFAYKSKLPAHYAFDIETEGGRISACSFVGYDIAECEVGPEREVIQFMDNMVAKYNPDILDSYWGSYFDVRRLMERAKHHHIKLKWGRAKGRIYIKRRKYRRGPKIGVENTVRIPGRIHFDVWKEVDLDQTLTRSGIKNHKLRTVAEWFGVGKKSEYDHSKLGSYGDDVVREECIEDSRICWELAERYLRKLYVLSEKLSLPLNMLVERSPSHVPNYIHMRELKELGIVCDKANYERFPQFFVKGRKAYQGAYTKLFKPGIYGPLKNADFKGMYPAIMACYGLSSETVQLLSVEPMECTGLEPPEFHGDEIWIYDDKVGLFKSRILEGGGFTRRWLRDLTAWRDDVKAKLNEHPKDTYLESEQYAIKVIQNALYGYHGMRYARAGLAPIAAIVTAVGRWWMLETIDWLKAKDIDSIECDTDGNWYEGSDFAGVLTEHIRSLIPSRYDPSFIKVATKSYDGAIFYEEKGYLLKKGDKVLRFGSGLKGRHLPRVCDNAAIELAEGIFAGEDIKSILWKWTRIKNRYPLEDFAMTMELHKENYKSKTMHYKLIKQLEATGVNVDQGAEIRYVKCKRGYKPLGLPERSYDLDYPYYRKRIAAILARILGPTKKMSRESIFKIIKEGQMIL